MTNPAPLQKTLKAFDLLWAGFGLPCHGKAFHKGAALQPQTSISHGSTRDNTLNAAGQQEAATGQQGGGFPQDGAAVRAIRQLRAMLNAGNQRTHGQHWAGNTDTTTNPPPAPNLNQQTTKLHPNARQLSVCKDL